MSKRNNNYVSWDSYWIKNNPTKETLEKELEKFEDIQKRELDKNISITNNSITKRQWKINQIKKLIKNYV